LFCGHEERYSRKKHDSKFPILALKAGLKQARLQIFDIDVFVYYENPWLKALRLTKSAITTFPEGLNYYIGAYKNWRKNKKLFIKSKIIQIIKAEFNCIAKVKVVYGLHHHSHACSAYFPSGFSESAVLCIDGVGEFDTCSIWHATESGIRHKKSIKFPTSLGLLYSAFTYYCGFKVNSGEYKLMGLAPYGEPKYYKDIVENLFINRLKESCDINMKYFCYDKNNIMINKYFIDLFGSIGARLPESPMSEHYLDIACSIQKVLEEAVLELAKKAKKLTGSKNLCMSGGVALNCVANGKLHDSKIFESIWIQPASGDAGSALGCAIGYYNKKTKRKSEKSKFNPYLGSEYNDAEVKEALDSANAFYREVKNDNELYWSTAQELNEGKIIGWHQGRSEFGPRALGGRSILGDARNKDSQKRINIKIKKREGFRPFAPIVLKEEATKYFEMNAGDASPYMLFVHRLRKDICKEVDQISRDNLIERVNQYRSNIPAVTHVDYSARVQTVEKGLNGRIYELLNTFYKQTGCAVLVNTSFNVRGEPIVETPLDAYRCFMNTDMDILVINDFVLRKEEQPIKNIERYKQSFVKD